MTLIGEPRQVGHLARRYARTQQRHCPLDAQPGLIRVRWKTHMGRKDACQMETAHTTDPGELIERDRLVGPLAQVVPHSGHCWMSLVRAGFQLNREIEHRLQAPLETSPLFALRHPQLDCNAKFVRRYDKWSVLSICNPKVWVTREGAEGGELPQYGRLEKKRPNAGARAGESARLDLAWLEQDRAAMTVMCSDPSTPDASATLTNYDPIPFTVEPCRKPTVTHPKDFDTGQSGWPYESGARVSCWAGTPMSLPLLTGSRWWNGHRGRPPRLQDTCLAICWIPHQSRLVLS